MVTTIEDLPEELQLQIFQYLPYKDFLRLKDVSRTWQRISSDRSLRCRRQLDITGDLTADERYSIVEMNSLHLQSLSAHKCDELGFLRPLKTSNILQTLVLNECSFAFHELEPFLSHPSITNILVERCEISGYLLPDKYLDDEYFIIDLGGKNVTFKECRLVRELGPPGVKAAMDMIGMYGGNCRRSLLPVSEQTKQRIASILKEYEN